MKTVTGDLLELRSGVILHQVNCLGATGGLAGALRQKWPRAFAPYLDYCKRNRQHGIGGFVIGQATPSLIIGHVFGQVQPGPSTDLLAVKESLDRAQAALIAPVYAPYKMGCGLGGGNWAAYRALLTIAFPDITIVQREEDMSNEPSEFHH